MKIKGNYEVDMDRREWWFVIILVLVVAGLITGNLAVPEVLATLVKRLK